MTKRILQPMDRSKASRPAVIPLHKTYFEQAEKAGYKAMVVLMFGPHFSFGDPAAVTGFKTKKRADKYADKLQSEFPKARIEVVEIGKPFRSRYGLGRSAAPIATSK